MSWKDYQEEAAQFFRSIGMQAETDATVKGVRTNHDVDVLVTSSHAGFELKWLIECKKWRTRVSKLHVLALREIVSDAGADRGILLSESGFQSGAVEAANLTNVWVTSLGAARTQSEHQIMAMRLREIYDRNESAKERYWALGKEERIRLGLRPDVGHPGYSSIAVMSSIDEMLSKAMREMFPFQLEGLPLYFIDDMLTESNTAKEAVGMANRLLFELEMKLDAAMQA